MLDLGDKISSGVWWIPKCCFFTALKSDNAPVYLLQAKRTNVTGREMPYWRVSGHVLPFRRFRRMRVLLPPLSPPRPVPPILVDEVWKFKIVHRSRLLDRHLRHNAHRVLHRVALGPRLSK